MLENLLDRNLGYLTLGARAHARLNTVLSEEIQAAMDGGEWCCHKCQTYLPGLLEIDHTQGHSPSRKSGLKPICAFCHERDHPVWAVGRGRFALMHAPDLSYEEISQMTWALLGNRGNDGFFFDSKKLARDIKARTEDAADALGHGNPEALIEAIFAFSDARGKDAAKAQIERIEAQIKLVPSALVDLSLDIYGWHQSGFRAADASWREGLRGADFPTYEALKAAGKSLVRKL